MICKNYSESEKTEKPEFAVKFSVLSKDYVIMTRCIVATWDVKVVWNFHINIGSWSTHF